MEEEDEGPGDDHVVVRSDDAGHHHHGKAHPAEKRTKTPNVDGARRRKLPHGHLRQEKGNAWRRMVCMVMFIRRTSSK